MSKTYQTGLIIEADNFRDKGSDRIAFVAHRLTGTELPGGVVFRHVLSIGDNAVTVPHFGYNYRCGKGGACPIHGTELLDLRETAVGAGLLRGLLADIVCRRPSASAPRRPDGGDR